MSNILQDVQFYDKYSRYNYALGRREDWLDSVTRVTDYLFSFVDLSDRDKARIFNAIYNKEVMPSMRNLAMAGAAAERQNACSYNCSAFVVDDLHRFYEAVIILMSGSGLGYSVESKHVNKLPAIRTQFHTSTKITFIVPDTTEGWADAVYYGLETWFAGKDLDYDFSRIRPAGSPLVTKGGRASGPDVLITSLAKIKEIVLSRQGMKLRPIDAHDIMCHIAKCIVSGGVRRCLPEGSRVHTRYGMRNIELVNIGDEVLTANGYYKVLNKFDQGNQRVVRVVTQDSHFECTPNHRLAVLSDTSDNYLWKMASELTPGDRLVSPSFSIEGKKQVLPSFTYDSPPHSTTCKDIVIPELDENLAWLLGLLQGDGYVRLTKRSGEISVSINKDTPDIIVRAEEQLQRFGVNIGKVDYENYVNIRVKSKQLATYFHKWLKQPNTPLQIPSFIWDSPRNIKLAYVSGLMDADGSAKTRPTNIVTSIYDDFTRDIQRLLSSCGVQTRVKKLSEKNLKKTWKPKYAVNLINNRSKEIFKNINTLSKNEFPVAPEKKTNTYKNGYSNGINKSWSDTNNRLIPVEFLYLEDVSDERKTWDLEVDTRHEFFCNGYLMHNSAMISIFDFDDTEMLSCKDAENISGNEQRYLANNSAVIENRLSYDQLSEFMNRMFASYSGEPGLFSRYAIEKTLPERRKYDPTFTPNPCQPGFAKVLTPEGIRTFDQIDVGTRIWSEDGWVTVINKTRTGNKPVFEYITTGGTFVGTDNHRIVSYGIKIEVGNADSIDLLPGQNTCVVRHNIQDVIDGLVIGDGSVHLASKNKIYLNIGKNDLDYFNSDVSRYILEPHAVKYGSAWNVNTTISVDELPHTYERRVPDRFYYGSHDTVCAFLSGLYSANGSVVNNRITLKSSSYTLMRQVQEMLSSVGIRSYYTTNKPTFVQHHNGLFESKQSYDLNISSDRDVFRNKIGFIQGYKSDRLEQACLLQSNKSRKTHDIVDEQYLGDYDVYEITVDGKSHTYWSSGLNVSNCGEIILRGSGQFCNLSSVVCRPGDTLTDLREKVEIAAIIGTIQSIADFFPGLSDSWKQNQEEERLLGVDLNGIMDVPEIRDPRVLTILREHAVNTNQEYAIKFKIKPAAAVTCIKPSGNSSVLLDTSPGIHARWSDFYVRRIQLSESNPILQVLRYHGVPVEPSNHLENTYVATFPVKVPDGAITSGTLSALEQLENWKLFKLYWTEHNPSCTIAYHPDEQSDIINWLYENQEIISGLSFLPKSDAIYQQMPYEKITEKQYYELLEDFPTEINWNLLHLLEQGLGDTTNASQLAACSGDKCLIDF